MLTTTQLRRNLRQLRRKLDALPSSLQVTAWRAQQAALGTPQSKEVAKLAEELEAQRTELSGILERYEEALK